MKEAVTETFLHETAVSVPQLWRLSDCLPANACRWVAIGKDRGRESDARQDSGIDGALQNGVRSTGITVAPNPPPLADAEHSAIKCIDCK